MLRHVPHSIHRRGASSVVVLALAFLAGCGDQRTAGPTAQASAPATPAPAATPADPRTVKPAPELAARIVVGTPPVVKFIDPLRVPARIEVDAQRVARVGATVTGRVTDIVVNAGEDVRRGQVLARLNSTELSSAQLGLLKAHAQRELAARAVTRAKQLLDADVIGVAEMQRRESELVQADADLSAFRDQLQVLGMPPASIGELIATRRVESMTQVVASLSGTVIERKVTAGQVVQPADPMFLVADLASVWLVAEVPEQRAGGVRVGAPIEAEIAALPGRVLSGTLSFVAATVDPSTRTVLVRTNLPNPDRAYKPAMLATMTVPGAPIPAPAVPGVAVVEEEGREHVFVARDGGAFTLRPVTLAPGQDGMRRIVSGVRPDETVVLEGAIALEAERRRSLAR
jgi:cobalt-zinc-cadmium efflux system membrane fusion protein